MTMLQAINGTLKELFRENPDTFLWGQDVAYKDKGGIFNVTKGMQAEFGARRVFNGWSRTGRAIPSSTPCCAGVRTSGSRRPSAIDGSTSMSGPTTGSGAHGRPATGRRAG